MLKDDLFHHLRGAFAVRFPEHDISVERYVNNRTLMIDYRFKITPKPVYVQLTMDGLQDIATNNVNEAVLIVVEKIEEALKKEKNQ